MQRVLTLEDGRELTINICDICGHPWIQKTEGLSQKCPHRGCNSWTWNREGINQRDTQHRAGRPGKREQEVKGLRPILDIETGRHSALCPCLLCLVDIAQEVQDRQAKLYSEWIAKVCPRGQRTSGEDAANKVEGRTLRGSGPLKTTFAHLSPLGVDQERCPS
jgi:hypothetical protein